MNKFINEQFRDAVCLIFSAEPLMALAGSDDRQADNGEQIVRMLEQPAWKCAHIGRTNSTAFQFEAAPTNRQQGPPMDLNHSNRWRRILLNFIENSMDWTPFNLNSVKSKLKFCSKLEIDLKMILVRIRVLIIEFQVHFGILNFDFWQ